MAERRPPTFSVVVETDNVELDDLGALRQCLDSVGGQQPVLGRAEGVFLKPRPAAPKRRHRA